MKKTLVNTSSRRTFLKRSGALLGATSVLPMFSIIPHAGAAAGPANSRLNFGAIGMKYQGSVVADKAQAHGDIVAICDVDSEIAAKARAQFGGKADLCEDYRKLLDRKDIDVVTIGTPDHWHAAMVIDACRAGKDVYIEKPLTLTVEEGQLIAQVVQQTKRVVQVGSWQRSDRLFRLAAELVRQGRLGKLERVEIVLGKNKTGGPFAEKPVPANLNWNLWQGQTPSVPYIEERCHFNFRWWHEYSGGQMTDNGAHQLDIAQWAIDSLPVEIKGQAKFPNVPNGYNVATEFSAEYKYANGVVMSVTDTGVGGIAFKGSLGTLFVNRSKITGPIIDQLKDQPLPRTAYKLYAHDDPDRPERTGKLEAMINHMANFVDCIKSRRTPISDVVSQHQSVTACHLGVIAQRLGRPLRWDPKTERFLGDAEANTWLRRPQRKGFELSAA